MTPSPSTGAPAVRTVSQKAAITALLEEHRLAQQDQVRALTFADPNDSSLDPGARMRATAIAKRTLAEIDGALLRLADGSYGFCVGCAEPIPSERLLVVPYTPRCVHCA